MKFRFFIIGIILFSAAALAQVPQVISYQGILKDANNQVVPNGDYFMQFKIWSEPIGGIELWSSSTGSIPITVRDGYFSHLLGSSSPLPEVIINFDSLWLGIKVGTDDELSPRLPITSSMFNFKSIKSVNSDTAIVSLDKTIDASELSTGTLNIERYSAYNDLVSEGRIGNGANQVASGNHSHFIQGMIFIEDTSYVEIDLPPYSAWMPIKTMIIPPNTLGYFFRLLVAASINANQGHVKVFINGQDTGGLSDLVSARISQLDFVKFQENQYLVASAFNGYTGTVLLDTTQPITIEVDMLNSSPSGIGGACHELVVYTGQN
jgi:hypothetical protein